MGTIEITHHVSYPTADTLTQKLNEYQEGFRNKVKNEKQTEHNRPQMERKKCQSKEENTSGSKSIQNKTNRENH